MDFLERVILTLLTLDTIRAIIAMLGWVKPDCKFAWLIYGRYERNVVKNALKELGYSEEKAARICKSLNGVAEHISSNTGIQEEDAAVQLIIMLSKYIVKFRQPIQYGGERISKSHFYINTMEISHNTDDKKNMVAIMVHLLNQHLNKKPSYIFTPKAGNPLFAQELATVLGSNLVLAKAPTDKSRVTTVPPSIEASFAINYEGIGSTNKINGRELIILDCNTTNGSQLLEVVHDIRQITGNDTKIINIFTLFRVDNGGDDIDKKFENHKSSLIRFFDLDEDAKRLIYQIQQNCKREKREPSIYNDEDADAAKKILEGLAERGKLYYEAEELYVEVV